MKDHDRLEEAIAEAPEAADDSGGSAMYRCIAAAMAAGAGCAIVHAMRRRPRGYPWGLSEIERRESTAADLWGDRE
jgi:hypothetical protein